MFKKYLLLITCFVTSLLTEEIIWRQKLIVKDFTGNDKGWVEVIISSYVEEGLFGYKTEVYSDTNLPFWFFTGASKTKEIEYIDENFLIQKSEFEINSKNEELKIFTYRENDKVYINLQSSKKGKKVKELKFRMGTLTPGNLRFLVMGLGLEEHKKSVFYLLDKVYQEYMKIVISLLGKTVLDGQEVYKINVNLFTLGNFNFYIDRDYNVVYGEGMGIRVFPEKN